MSRKIQLLDPITGAPLAVNGTLRNLYMTIGVQIITYDYPTAREQHTPPLTEPYCDEAQSYCLGIHQLTNASRGGAFSTTCYGTGQGAPVALTT